MQEIWHFGTPLGATFSVIHFRKLFSRTTFIGNKIGAQGWFLHGLVRQTLGFVMRVDLKTRPHNGVFRGR